MRETYESASENLKDAVKTFFSMYRLGLSKIIGENALQEIEALSPFTNDQSPTPLCINKSVVVSKKAHNIMYCSAVLGLGLIARAYCLPREEAILSDMNGNDIVTEFYSAQSLIEAGLGLSSLLGAGLTLFCTKRLPDPKEENSDSDFHPTLR